MIDFMDEDIAEEEVKDILFKKCFSYRGKNEDEVFEKLYSIAYQKGHSNGYNEVKIEFEELDEFLSSVLDLIR